MTTRSKLMERFQNDSVFYQWTKVIESAVMGKSLTIDDFFGCVMIAKELIERSEEVNRVSKEVMNKFDLKQSEELKPRPFDRDLLNQLPSDEEDDGKA